MPATIVRCFYFGYVMDPEWTHSVYVIAVATSECIFPKYICFFFKVSSLCRFAFTFPITLRDSS